MSDSRYKGNTNWETWNFKLWLENDEPTYREIQALAKEHHRDVMELANDLERTAWDCEAQVINDRAGFFNDVCNKAIQAVNFYEIAQAYINDLDNN